MVYRLALELNINGWVCNASDGLHIEFNASEAVATQFYDHCLSKPPAQAHIAHHQLTKVPDQTFNNFTIVESTSQESIEIAITPDFALCKACTKELTDPNDKRFEYSFITCTHCGPRYSILKGLPYDRPYTSMAAFDMCDECKNEYDNPLDRRYYSQTNSCATCGIELKLLSKTEAALTSKLEVFEQTVASLRAGKIVAVKGIGGYLLLCDAASSKPVNELRKRKNRPHKPFAVMYPNMDLLQHEFRLLEDEIKLLQGPVAPIVLLPFSSNKHPGIVTDAIAPGLQHIGVMMPYAPLLFLITRQFGRPVVATSANDSGMPIIYQDRAEDFDALWQYADFILTHNREIVMPQDDSVMKFTPGTRRKIILRRARGLAPNMLSSKRKFKANCLSLGAEIKGTFALAINDHTYSAQYLGNMSGYENQMNYRRVLKQFFGLTGFAPNKVLFDQHPQYFTHQMGKEMAEELEVDTESIQHHEAHFASVLGEHDLDIVSERVLGVVWDGTGYGTDEQIWGGEFFEFSNNQIERIAHLR